MGFRDSTQTRDAKLSALIALCNNGYIEFRTGAKPATPNTAATGTLLAVLRFGATSFPAPSSQVLTANAITPDSSADATGSAAHARIKQSDNTTPVWDLDITVTGGGGDITMPTVSIVALAEIGLSSFTYALPME